MAESETPAGGNSTGGSQLATEPLLAATIAQFSWVCFCMSFLVALTRAAVGCLRAKPILMITQIDLVHQDLSLAYCFLFCSSASVHLVITLNRVLPVPPAIAAAASFNLAFAASCFLSFLAASASVQFALVRRRAFSLVSEQLTDEAVRAWILLSVVVLSALGFGVAAGAGRSYPLYHAMLGDAERETSLMSLSIAFCLALAAAAAALNAVFRFLILREKRMTTEALGQTSISATEQRPPPPYGIYLVVTLALALLGSLSVLPAGRAAHDAKRFAVLGIFCVLVPSLFAAKVEGFRKHVLRKVLGMVPTVARARAELIFSNRVGPPGLA